MNSNQGIMNGGYKVKKQKFGIGTFFGLLLFGGIFVGAGAYAISQNRIDPSWTYVNGVVVDASRSSGSRSVTYMPVVKYRVLNQEYRVTSTSGSSFYPTIGAMRDVAYNPAHPEQAKAIDSNVMQALLFIFPLIGIVILIAAPIAFVKSFRRS